MGADPLAVRFVGFNVRTKGTQWIAIDFDWTIWDNANNRPMEGAADAIETLRSQGFKVIIHSCNRPGFIKQQLLEHSIVVDGIWGESPLDHGNKPVASVFIDDRAIHFTTWAEALPLALEMAGGRPVKDSRGVNWVEDET